MHRKGVCKTPEGDERMPYRGNRIEEVEKELAEFEAILVEVPWAPRDVHPSGFGLLVR